MLSYLKAHLVEFAAWIFIALSPIRSALLTIAALVVLDLITGVWAARKRGEAITSLGFRRTTVKVFVYMGALVLGFVVEKNLLAGAIPLTQIIGGWVGLTELKSNAENLHDVTGLDIWQALLDRLAGISAVTLAAEEIQKTPPEVVNPSAPTPPSSIPSQPN